MKSVYNSRDSYNAEIVPEPPAHHPKFGYRSDRHKSAQRRKVANDQLLPSDNRSTWARRCREVLGDLVADLGGSDNASTAMLALARRSAVLIVELEVQIMPTAQINRRRRAKRLRAVSGRDGESRQDRFMHDEPSERPEPEGASSLDGLLRFLRMQL
jgi:hypothetical protein